MARRTSAADALASVRRRSRAPGWVVLFVVLAVLAVQYLPEGLRREPAGPPVDPGEPEQTYFVERVVDGDTLKLSNGDRVRLIGVDTPEAVTPDRPVEPLGPEASRHTRQLVEGKTVRLAFDKERRDRFGRILAYVYFDGVLLNEELIRAGYSKAQLQYPYSSAMKKRFREAEAEAKAGRRGLWNLPVQTGESGESARVRAKANGLADGAPGSASDSLTHSEDTGLTWHVTGHTNGKSLDGGNRVGRTRADGCGASHHRRCCEAVSPALAKLGVDVLRCALLVAASGSDALSGGRSL